MWWWCRWVLKWCLGMSWIWMRRFCYIVILVKRGRRCWVRWSRIFWRFCRVFILIWSLLCWMRSLIIWRRSWCGRGVVWWFFFLMSSGFWKCCCCMLLENLFWMIRSLINLSWSWNRRVVRWLLLGWGVVFGVRRWWVMWLWIILRWYCLICWLCLLFLGWCFFWMIL